MSEEAGVRSEEWRRTSPLSFVVRAIMGLRNLVFPALALLFGTQGWDGGGAFVVPAIAAMVAFSTIFTLIAWRHFRYRLGDSDIRVERGLFNRTARAVPYERIQDVSLEQALVPRLFGMVEVRFETGAGGKDELKIAYVTEAEGAALREAVRAERSGAAVPAAEASSPADDEAETLFAMGPRRVLIFGLFNFSLVAVAALGGAAQQFDFLLPFDLWDVEEWGVRLAGPGQWLAGLGFAAQLVGAVLALSILLLVGFATGLIRTVLREWGFLLERTPRGLRRRRGLLTRTDVVMPLHRVQALRIATGAIRKRFGWHGLSLVSLASDRGSANHAAAPFARMDEIAPIVALTGFALPAEDLVWRETSARYHLDRWFLRAALLTLITFAIAFALLGDARFLAALLPGAGVLALCEFYRWRLDRHALGQKQLFVRSGWLRPRLTLGSRVKLQSVEIVQGPLGRRSGYATLHLGLAGGRLAIAGMALGYALEWRTAVLGSMAAADFSELVTSSQLQPDSGQARKSDHSGFSANLLAT